MRHASAASATECARNNSGSLNFSSCRETHERFVRAAFPRPVNTPEEARAALIAMVTDARMKR